MWLYLPVTEKPLHRGVGAKGADVARGAASRRTVLLVDDDADVRDVVLDALNGLGCEVETAASGDQAIALIQSGKEYDLVFTDVVMAGEAGGRDVARAARAMKPGVPVVLCSGFPREMLDREDASLKGALFLAKPFHQDKLVAIVERALQSAQTNLSAAPF